MSEIRAFIDSNGFIQLRDLKDLSWGKLFPDAKIIRLMVSSVVIDELDNLKTSTNQRKRDRARAALKLIDDASQENDFAKVLRDTPIKVLLVIANDEAPDWSAIPKLDRSRPDDKLVADAFTHGNGAVLFSHDTGPRIRARLVGIHAVAPPDDWLLPAEQTDDQRRMAAIQRELEASKSARPRLSLETPEISDDTITFIRPFLPDLSADEIEQATKAYLRMCPRETFPSYGKHGAMMFIAGYVSDAAIDDYNNEYDLFEKSTQEYFRSLNRYVLARTSVQPVSFKVLNIGTISARKFTFEASVSPGYKIMGDPNGEASVRPAYLSAPQAPERPQPRHLGSLDHLNFSTPYFRNNAPSDPTAMEWIDGPPGMGRDFTKFGCDDFRPDREYVEEVWVQVPYDAAFTGTLTVEIGAEHHTTLSKSVIISASQRSAKWDEDAVAELFPDAVRQILSKVMRK